MSIKDKIRFTLKVLIAVVILASFIFLTGCYTGCVDDDECTDLFGDGGICMGGYCTKECSADGDCDSLSCVNGLCARPCQNDEYCRTKRKCKSSTKKNHQNW